jgi:serine/threonine protein kinase
MQSPREATQSDPASRALRAYVARLRARPQLFDRYEIVDEVAEGGMGAVYRVVDHDGGRQVALKVLLKDPTEGDEPPSMERLKPFLTEARLTSQLDHPGVVPVHEIGLDPTGRPYFTMRLVEGDTLREVFEKAQLGVAGWNQTRVVSALLKVCETVAYAHHKGVIHRDLKPGNVMVGRFGEVYVVDWGLARRIERRKAPREVSGIDDPAPTLEPDDRTASAGTPAYMSPEQAYGDAHQIGPRSDVYAIGSMLYHLLTGHAPYCPPEAVPASTNELLALVREGPPQPVLERRHDAPHELAAICHKAMAREPSQRYRTMEQIADDLRAWLEGRVVNAAEHGPLTRARKWMGRNRSTTATAALAAILLSALASWAITQINAERDFAMVQATLAEEDAIRAQTALMEARRKIADGERHKAEVKALEDRIAELESQIDGG